ncbi:MAG: hypothetical protein JXM70_14700 [Pirellulales bacterium]|nr:hypothetical protein [Pirellulales bacterium]
MFKTVAVKAIQYGAVYCVFGVFGVLIVMLPWFRNSTNREEHEKEGALEIGDPEIGKTVV